MRASGRGRILQHPVVAGVGHIEVAGCIYCDAPGRADLSDGITSRGDYRPRPLGIPLIDALVRVVAKGEIEVTCSIHREGGKVDQVEAYTSRTDRRPASLGVPLLYSI